MRQIELGDVIIQKLTEEEIPAVRSIAEDALASTYDAYHAADAEPPEEDIDEDREPPQFFGERGASYKIIHDGEVIGGVFLSFDSFDPHVQTGTLDLFGIRNEQQGRGIGRQVWKTIEELHADVRIWRLHTPAYALRNVAFYVNQCGFVLYQITTGDDRYDWHMFRMRKVMPASADGATP